MPEPHLSIEIKHRIGSLQLDIGFATDTLWTVLFGASGSGKSTVLRAIAGLVRPDRGRIVCDGRMLVDTDAGGWVAAHRRAVRWAGQTAMLFPRMTVRQNLEFGMSDATRVQEAIAHFGLAGLVAKRPGELSGGERQRVGVVRAAVGEAKLLLLDEPFTGLDARRRDELMAQLREWIGATPVVSVTHDVGEAFLLAAEVVRISDGKVVARGPAEVVLREERERLKAVLG